ncbi:MAG TPA: carboxypeptidase regulatory-like domain-containing protein [Pyrinomonadaceae bacterium]|jgi:hypothetical protein|nr:carboxypeptidase regulatory-like domain-containing protein [Pyrinomonadaceae bacterium]
MRFRSSSRTIGILLGLGSMVLLPFSLSTARNQENPRYKPTGNEGAIIGTISFMGIPPEPLRIDTSADPICETINPGLTTDWVIVNDKKLANVVVYVRAESLKSYSFDAPSGDIILEHKGCAYAPHVLGMQTQQTLKIVNSDATFHNTHPVPKNNIEWNQSQPPGTAPIERSLKRAELFVPFKDNQHPWEKAYVGVFTHPFFSVSGIDGSYKISGLPPGEYTVVAWHEKFGEQSASVFVAGNEQKTLDFEFKKAVQ